MITSTTNERVKFVRALSRRKTRQQEGRFVIEGVRLAEEAWRANVRPDFVFYTDDLAQRGKELVERWHGSGVICLEVSPGVMKASSDTESPAGLLAVVPFAVRPLPNNLTLCVIADGIRDPGNMGTLLRTASAAGADAVLLGPGTVDVYNSKVIRAAIGAHFHLPIRTMTWPAIESHLSNTQVWLADARGEMPYFDIDWTLPSALIIGGEAEGSGPESAQIAAGRVNIPMHHEAESLNAAVAAAVILFEAARQRFGLAKET